MDSILKIRNRIDTLLSEQDTVLVAIDGNCTAGKTTLAALLAEEYSCNVVHVDEFFLQKHQRTPERLAEAGGNVDYERFLAEVLTPLRRGEALSYRPYDCRTQALREPVCLPKKKVTVVEGTYSCHPYFNNPYDLTVFLSVSDETQRQRVMERPAFKHDMFFNVWIPMEQRYFDTFSIRAGCDLSCSGEEAWD